MNRPDLRRRLRTLRRWLPGAQRRHGAGGYLCLAPQPEGLAIVEVERRGARPRLLRQAWAPRAAGGEWPAGLGRGYAAGLVLPFADYRLQVVDAPNVPAEELDQAVRWLIASRLPDEPIEELAIAFVPMPDDRAGAAELLTVAAHNPTLRQYVERARATGLQVTHIGIPELAQSNLATRLAESERFYALLSLTPAGGLLTVTRAGELLFYRHFELDWARLNADEPLRAQAQIERVGLELQRSLDYLERHHAAWQIDCVHLAPTLRQGLAERLGAGLTLPLRLTDLTAALDGVAELDPASLAHIWFALGLALPPPAESRTAGFNLYSVTLSPQPPGLSARTMAWAFLALAAMGLPVTVWAWLQARAAEALYAEALAAFDALNAQFEAQAVQASLAPEATDTEGTAARQRRLLERLAQIDRTALVSTRLAALSRAAMPGLWLTEITLQPADYRLRGHALDAGLLPEYLRRLTTLPGFAGIPADALSLKAEEGRYAFTLDSRAQRP